MRHVVVFLGGTACFAAEELPRFYAGLVANFAFGSAPAILATLSILPVAACYSVLHASAGIACVALARMLVSRLPS